MWYFLHRTLLQENDNHFKVRLYHKKLKSQLKLLRKIRVNFYTRKCNKFFLFNQTKYNITKEEVEVYKHLGDHNNIVKHLGGTFHGNEGLACIFMELCGMYISLHGHAL